MRCNITKKTIYMDNASSTHTKPEEVYNAVNDFMKTVAVRSSRYSHSLSLKSMEMITQTRNAIARMFNVKDPSRVIFTNNCTTAINTVLYGVINDDDKIVISSLEHNSIMRPLGRLFIDKNIKIVETEHTNNYTVDLFDLYKKSLGAEMVIVSHGDNVTGAVNNIADMVDITHKNGAYILVDASQTAGLINIDVDGSGVDFLVLSGNKNLFAPHGVGIMILGKDIQSKDIRTMMQGRTDALAEFEIEPDIIPDKFEIGTLNYLPIAGLQGALGWIEQKGIDSIYYRTETIKNRLLEGLKVLNNVTFYHTLGDVATNIISLNMKGIAPIDLATLLDKKYNIIADGTLQSNPRAHKYLDTYPTGAVRFSPNAYSTFNEIDAVIDAMKEISNRVK